VPTPQGVGFWGSAAPWVLSVPQNGHANPRDTKRAQAWFQSCIDQWQCRATHGRLVEMVLRPKDTVWHNPFGVHVGWAHISPQEPKRVGRDLHPSFFNHPWSSSSNQCTETPLLCLGNSAFVRNEMAKPTSGPAAWFCSRAELVTGHGLLITCQFIFLGLTFPDPVISLEVKQDKQLPPRPVFLLGTPPSSPTLTSFLSGAPVGAGGAGACR